MRLVNLERILNLINPAYYCLYREHYKRYKILLGGSGSGKSFAITDYLIYRAIEERNHKFLIIRKVAKTLKTSVFDLLIERLGMFGFKKGVHYSATKSPLEINFHTMNTQFIFTGLDDPEKIKSVSGVTTIFIEEVTELTLQDFTQLDLRLRGITKHRKEILAAFNPISANHWIKNRFWDNIDPLAMTLKTTYKDNKFIDETYKQTLENLKYRDPNYYNIYALGNWGLLKGAVFTNYKIEHIADKQQYLDDYMNLRCGMDFGYSVDPTAAPLLHIDKRNKVIRILKEVYGRGMSGEKISRETKLMLGPKLAMNLDIAAESADPRLRDELEIVHKLRMYPVKKGADSINYGIEYLKKFDIIIDDSCVNTAREFQLYKWLEDKDGNLLNKPVDKHNDMLDAIRYALENDMLLERENTVEAGISIW